MADFINYGDQNDKEEKTAELQQEAINETLDDSSNVSYEDHGEVTEVDTPDQDDYQEGDASAEADLKDTAAEDTNENLKQVSDDSDDQVGNGAFSSARGGWANGGIY